jgi:hypothetical protein
MELKYFFILVAILFILMFIFDKKEKFDNEKSKQCSQKAINNAYNKYIFSSPQFMRR